MALKVLGIQLISLVIQFRYKFLLGNVLSENNIPQILDASSATRIISFWLLQKSQRHANNVLFKQSVLAETSLHLRRVSGENQT